MHRAQVLAEMVTDHPSGSKLVELSREELTKVYGGGDVQPETTPVCAVGGGIALGIALSKLFC